MKKLILILLVLPLMTISSLSQGRKILLEEFTGDWCGCCPRGHLVLDSLIREYQDIIPVLIHGGSADEPMATQDGEQFSVDLNVWYPSASIDRFMFDGEENIVFSDYDWRERLIERIKEPAFAEITLEKSFDENTRQLDLTVNVEFTGGAKGDFRYNAYILEDGLVYDQANNYDEDSHYPDLFGRGDPITGYVHNNVLRKMLAGPYGNNPAGEGHIPQNVAAGESYSHSFTTIIDEEFKLNQLHIVAYVMSYDGLLGSEVLNAVSVPLIETGYDHIRIKKDLCVYPNPARGDFTISYETEKPERVDILIANICGQVELRHLWEKDAGKQLIHISGNDLAPGIYFLELRSGGQINSESLIISK